MIVTGYKWMTEDIIKSDLSEKTKAEYIDPVDRLRLVRDKLSKSFLKLNHVRSYSRDEFKAELNSIIKELVHISKKL